MKPQQQQHNPHGHVQNPMEDSTGSSNFTNGQIFSGKFRLEDKIGQGSFGMIFKCISIDTQEILAIKLEKQNGKQASMLIREIKVMMEMKNDKGFARLHSYGKDDEYNYVAMTYLGRNIDSLLRKCNGRFSTQTIVNIADQMITRLEAMHNKNLIHRDIKPENYVIGYGSNFTIVHLIDFGLAKYYKDSNGHHVPFVEKKGMIGTARYASVNAHLGYEQSRRDDLEALGYVLVYFARGKLPWQNIYADNKDEKYEKIKNMKQQLTLEQICENLPGEFVLYFKHVKQLAFEEQPNYAFLKKLFQKIASDKKLDQHAIHTVDWEGLPDYRQRKKYNTSAASFAARGPPPNATAFAPAVSNAAQQNKEAPHQQQQQDVDQRKVPNHMLQTNPNNPNAIKGSSNNINTADQNYLLQFSGDTISNTAGSGLKIDGLKQNQNNNNAAGKSQGNSVMAYHPVNSNPNITTTQKQILAAGEAGGSKHLIQLYDTEANEPSVHLHVSNANNNNQMGSRNDEPMSNLNPFTSQYLNVPTNYDKATHSVNSANSGDMSRLNNYLWSDSEDIISDEGIVVPDFISKENQPFHTKTLFDDIRVRSSQMPHVAEDIDMAESSNAIKKHVTMYDKDDKKELYRKMSTYMGENINEVNSEMDREIKVFQVKTAFQQSHSKKG